nr:MAG TPA: hypothetical protein [Caudoviricetes sp.]
MEKSEGSLFFYVYQVYVLILSQSIRDVYRIFVEHKILD